MSLYEMTVPQLSKMLGNLDRWLQKAEALAQAKQIDADRWVHARLAIDQFTLAQQVQAASDTAKLTVARITGREAPKHADDESTMAELRARIGSVREYLATFSAADFEGASDRLVGLPFLPGKGAVAPEYLSSWGLPNFYFHVTTAYAILRHYGVELGKRDYIGGIELRDL